MILSGTHTHSGPGGFLMDLLYDITILGFVPQTFEAYVDGIVRVRIDELNHNLLIMNKLNDFIFFQSIGIAHESLTPAKIYYNEGRVANANINRSPSSYLVNPPSERAKYDHTIF